MHVCRLFSILNDGMYMNYMLHMLFALSNGMPVLYDTYVICIILWNV